MTSPPQRSSYQQWWQRGCWSQLSCSASSPPLPVATASLLHPSPAGLSPPKSSRSSAWGPERFWRPPRLGHGVPGKRTELWCSVVVDKFPSQLWSQSVCNIQSFEESRWELLRHGKGCQSPSFWHFRLLTRESPRSTSFLFSVARVLIWSSRGSTLDASSPTLFSHGLK